MSRKNRRSKPGPRQTPPKANQTQQPATPSQGDTPSPEPCERFVLVPEIAERLGGVTQQAVRNWGRAGKLPLRRLFGNTGNLGMPETELRAFIRGTTETRVTESTGA